MSTITTGDSNITVGKMEVVNEYAWALLILRRRNPGKRDHEAHSDVDDDDIT